MGNLPVTRVSLVIDSGWQLPYGDQILTVSNAMVNDNTYQWNAGGTGALHRPVTCPMRSST